MATIIILGRTNSDTMWTIPTFLRTDLFILSKLKGLLRNSKKDNISMRTRGKVAVAAPINKKKRKYEEFKESLIEVDE